jgi:hypothetical protein
MHERAVVTDLIRKAIEVAAEHGAGRVVSMTVSVGALSHVDPATLPDRVADSAVGTPVEGTRVVVVTNSGDPLDDPRAQEVRLVSVGLPGDEAMRPVDEPAGGDGR